ncbi:MAG: protein-L-isoaspartate(D-aspartate) O-methyltransferase [Alphaproteobacteria bacterium]
MNLIDGQGTLKRERLIAELRKNKDASERVLKAMLAIPRHKFLPAAFTGDAYDNSALPIGENQTISMPSVVAQMTEALDVQAHHKVLEIGTGSGYQAAILCSLCKRLFSIERHRSLAERAEKLLRSLGFHNLITMVADGTMGWPAQAPFDRIMVTAAGPAIPQALKDQLAVGGVMVIPVGATLQTQYVVRCTRTEAGFTEEILNKVVFVPLVGEQGVGGRKSA